MLNAQDAGTPATTTGNAGPGSMARRVLLAAIVASAAVAHAADTEGVVVGVSDGDTLTVLEANNVPRRVRLMGLDAPEKGQAFGARAKESLSDCAFGRRAVVAGEKIDRYGRLVGKVLVEGVDCNLRQVELGLAWHYKAYEREQTGQDRRAYTEAEVQAREGRLGLWKETAPQPPWDYRRERRCERPLSGLAETTCWGR
jgi:endonuclease YncB( thermonuclease family)